MPTRAPASSSADSALLVTLAGVAELARVQRPVASMWRARFAAGDDAFPASVGQLRGVEAFDVTEVAEWLTQTSHGNNPEAMADAAAAAVPADFSFADADAVAELEALVALHAHTDGFEELTVDQLRRAAAEADPRNVMFQAEIEAHADRGTPWSAFADRLIDAAFSPADALALIDRRRRAALGAAGSAGRLTAEALALITEAVTALITDASCTVVLDPHDAALAHAVAEAVAEVATLTLPSDSDARRVRRRLACDDVWLSEDPTDAEARTLVIRRVPASRGEDAAAMLRAIDEVALALRGDDAAVVVGPARALVDPVGPGDERVRADVLRSGRVRGVARLTPGLVESAPREALALWVLGAPTGDVPIAERFTVVADLSTQPLTPATRRDLVSDVVASMGSARAVRGHAFRFAKFARTASLLARGGSLVAAAAATPRSSPAGADLPVLLDAAARTVAPDVSPVAFAPTASQSPHPRTVADLIADGHVRVIPGTRLDPDLTGQDGLVVVSSGDLATPARLGATRVDHLAFATQYPNAQLTRPGDVIFRTSPTAVAWVDPEGSKVVAYPARILRITAADPGGLMPEVAEADITGAAPGPGAWKRWMLRRVAPDTIAPLRAALADIAAARKDLDARVARLDDYAALLVAGATSGAVTIIDSNTAADAASTQ